jgi:hypothetical protein
MFHNPKKQCSKCRRVLSVIHFASSGEGLESICRRCASRYKKNCGFHRKQSEAHPEYKAKAARKALDTASGKARQALRNAVYRGKLPKPDHCEICTKKTSRKELTAHHVDYDHKLEIVWACSYCHGILDSVMREAEAALADTNHEGCPWDREFRYPLTSFIVKARCLGLLETEFFAWLREIRWFLADEEKAQCHEGGAK